MVKARSPIWICMAAFILALTTIAATPRGSIRGVAYQDADGDGTCNYTAGGEDRPVPGMTVIFVSSEELVNLYTGNDGSYGFVAAGLGEWQVHAAPSAGHWSLISTNPQVVEISEATGLLQNDINFCLRSLGSLGSAPVAVAQSVGDFTESVSLLRGDASASGETLPADDTASVVSEAILTFVPDSEPPSDIATIAESPVGSSSTPSAEWLAYLNTFRAMAGLSDLVENERLTFGSQAHARYMVINDKPIAHSERADNPLFTAEGLQAAQNGNIFATTRVEAGYEWATNFWMSAPFHLIRIIDPALAEVGYGDFNEAVGNFHMSAVLDVASMIGDVPEDQRFPIYFPGEGTVTDIVRHSLYEWPDPVDSCAGYSRPTGPPLIVQLGDGSVTPSITGFTLESDGVLLPACAFGETTYTNPDQYAQANGRFVLGERDAVVILPRNPLEAGKSYTATLFANGQTFSWSFSAAD